MKVKVYSSQREEGGKKKILPMMDGRSFRT
jgi:hypothetical protein